MANVISIKDAHAVEFVADEMGNLRLSPFDPIMLDKKCLDTLGCQGEDTIVFERSNASVILRKK
ncbi:MAG: hypothetical protein FWE05_07285 [Defluviitaleaceae bacterium]|nr:hypothetical protein [Defluviitaleaceae bacterium]